MSEPTPEPKREMWRIDAEHLILRVTEFVDEHGDLANALPDTLREAVRMLCPEIERQADVIAALRDVPAAAVDALYPPSSGEAFLDSRDLYIEITRRMTEAAMPEPTPEPQQPREPVFRHMPSGTEIGQWFKTEAFARRYENVGGDAVLLWCGDDLYPYGTLHKLAEVDHDDQMFYLLDVGLHLSPDYQTSDLLFVTAGLAVSLECQWRNRPSHDQQWGRVGLIWFADMIESTEAMRRA